MTRKFALLSMLAVICTAAPGCNQSGLLGGSADTNFPRFLVGTWQADESRWILTFGPKGDLVRMRHFVGMEIDVSEGGLTEEGRGGITGTYTLGPCPVDYDPNDNTLRVDVVIEHFIIAGENESIEGSFFDTLVGPVSQEDMTWYVEWTSSSRLIDTDVSTVGPTPLTFTKVVEEEEAR
jgi:hypothetical protein